MVNFKEIFGRRKALVAFAIAAVCAVAVAISMTVAAFAADPDTYEGNSPSGIWSGDEAYFTSYVQAPKNATFDYSPKYTFGFDKDDSVADVPADFQVKTVTLPLKVVNGELITEAADSNHKTGVAYGYGESGFDESGNIISGDPVYPYEDVASVYGYYHQVKMDTIFDLGGKKTEEVFSKPGTYRYVVAMADEDIDAAPEGITPSYAEYVMDIVVVNTSGGTAIKGFMVWGVVNDWKKGIETDKICIHPKVERTYHPVWVPGRGEGSSEYEKRFQGFTFVNDYICIDEHYYDDLTLFHTVSGDYADENLDFNFPDFELYSNTFNLYAEMYGDDYWDIDVTGAHYVPAKLYKYDTLADAAARNPEKRVQVATIGFKVTLADEDDNGFRGAPAKLSVCSYQAAGEGTTVEPATSFDLRHFYALEWDDNMPVGSYYAVTEKQQNEYKGEAISWTANSDEDTSTGMLAKNTDINVSYLNSTKSDINNKNAIVAQTPDTPLNDWGNASIWNNTCEEVITGFMLDTVPYMVLIGIPVCAFIVWIVSRKRKANNR